MRSCPDTDIDPIIIHLYGSPEEAGFTLPYLTLPYLVSSGNIIYLKIVTELKTKSHLYMRKTRSSSSSSGTWHTMAAVFKELISLKSS